jgi:hypothetical protein
MAMESCCAAWRNEEANQVPAAPPRAMELVHPTKDDDDVKALAHANKDRKHKSGIFMVVVLFVVVLYND